VPNQSRLREVFTSVTAEVSPGIAPAEHLQSTRNYRRLQRVRPGYPSRNRDKFPGELLIVTQLNAIHHAVEARAICTRGSQSRRRTDAGARLIEQIRRRGVDAIVAFSR